MRITGLSTIATPTRSRGQFAPKPPFVPPVPPSAGIVPGGQRDYRKERRKDKRRIESDDFVILDL